MKPFNPLLIILFLFVVGQVFGQTNYTLSPNYKFTILGGSNLHDWTETASKVSGNSAVIWNSDGSLELNALKIVLDARSLRSTEGSIMNSKTYKALNTDKNPTIQLRLTVPLKAIPANANGYIVRASGDLTIAGVTRAVTLNVKVFVYGHDKIVFEGTEPIKMSDYHIDQITALFGMLKVSDDVKIKFNTTFSHN